jgi:hypothetical protein
LRCIAAAVSQFDWDALVEVLCDLGMIALDSTVLSP